MVPDPDRINPCATDMACFDSVRDRTVVFTLSRGVQVSPDDFLPHLQCVSGSLVAFGTVGVGHVWHLTLQSVDDVDTVIDQGNFTIRNRSVCVSRLASILTSATLFWLPYWVPHDDVIASLELLLDDRVSCNYVQLPQHGFAGCFSTQRKLRSPVDMKNLPYFVNISSEGRLYRTFLFVPGRPAVCFSCAKVGHMKNSCPDDQANRQSFKRPSSAIDIPTSKKHSPDPVEDSSMPVDLDKSFTLQMPDHLSMPVCSFIQNEMFALQETSTPPDPPKYRLIIRRDSGTVIISRKGTPIEVSPPETSDVPKKQQKVESKGCSLENCKMIGLWTKGHICADDMAQHFRDHHDDLIHLDPC